jgi:hypothetical protein
MNNGHLTRELILSFTKLPIEEVDVPEWNGKVYIRVMTAGERDAWEGFVKKFQVQDIRARTAVTCLCDADGKRLFTDDDMPALSNLHSKALDRIFEAAVILNAVGRDDIADLKKNSSTTPSADSSSSSPAISTAQSANSNSG